MRLLMDLSARIIEKEKKQKEEIIKPTPLNSTRSTNPLIQTIIEKERTSKSYFYFQSTLDNWDLKDLETKEKTEPVS